MESFSYIAIGKDGKEKKGSISGLSLDKATAALKAEGLIPISVKEQSFLTKDLNFELSKGIKPRDISLFCRQFVGIIAAGVTIIDTLGMISDQTQNKVLKKAIKETQVCVQKGETLANAMRSQGKVFPSILINMVEAGEATGSLEVSFERMAVHFEKEAKTRAMVKKALIYPCVVGIVAIAVIIIMLLVVIPNFQSMFDQVGSELPAITKVVVAASDFIVAYWYLILIVVFLAVVSIKVIQATPTGEEFFAQCALHMPVFGELKIKSYSSQYARTMSTLLAAGIPLIEALDITARTIDNKVVRDILLNAKEEVSRGVPLSTPLKASGVFPPMVCHMTKIGEETGNIEGMLQQLANYYDDEVEVATQSLTSAMEPMIIIVMAIIVGFLVMAIMSPMMQMYETMDAL